MNLPKAKEIIDLNIKEAGKNMPLDVKAALILSSEAIDRLIANRYSISPDIYELLPSETES